MFLPTTTKEIKALGWERPDIILITGDAYIDSPQMGVAVIGKYLLKHGFKTAVISQPSIRTGADIKRLGEPRLFWGVTAGSIDSMVANYTATKRYRHQDDYTPGGVNRRPNRATIAYTNLIRQFFKNTRPVILGGIEASLRRIAHYDYWDDAIRRSILFDSKADIIAYGMAEKTVVELARAIEEGSDWKGIKGICYVSGAPEESFITLPSFHEVSADKKAFLKMAKLFHKNACNTSFGLNQQHGDRFLIHNPPHPPLSTRELDEIYEINYEGDAHPYQKNGEIRALHTIKQSITTHRGCFGQCNFCSISIHQGPTVVSRSAKSVIDEARRISRKPGFNGNIYDVGGPTANMFGANCASAWDCPGKRCLMPRPCPNLEFGHRLQIEVLNQVRGISGINKVFVSSGIRPDLVIADKENAKRYVQQLVRYHVSGQIKLAPEHSEKEVLALMNKPSNWSLMKFREMFNNACATQGKRHFMTYYLIAAHPGCTPEHNRRLKDFLSRGLKTTPEQVQIFTPTPSTLSTAMYYCETDLKGNPLFCEKSIRAVQEQKNVLTGARGHRSIASSTPSKTPKTTSLPKSRPKSKPRRSSRTPGDRRHG